MMVDTPAADLPARILPGLDALNRDYWTGGADGRLLIAQCRDCTLYLHPPMPRCRRCGSGEIAPVAVSGRGKVASYSINHQAWLPRMAVPFIFAAVELVEQAELYVFTNILDCPIDAVRAGLAVRVTFLPAEDVFLPMFVPAGSDA